MLIIRIDGYTDNDDVILVVAMVTAPRLCCRRCLLLVLVMAGITAMSTGILLICDVILTSSVYCTVHSSCGHSQLTHKCAKFFLVYDVRHSYHIIQQCICSFHHSYIVGFTRLMNSCYFTLNRYTEYCEFFVCLFACLLVCLSAHISK